MTAATSRTADHSGARCGGTSGVSRRSLAPVRVFLVEDSQLLCERIVSAITVPGRIEVIGQAATEGAAIQGVAALRPEVIIIDIRLHEGNGVNVLRSISRMRESFAPTLIMLTNYAIPEYEKECLAMGADYFFDKATEFDRVNDVLEELACGRGS